MIYKKKYVYKMEMIYINYTEKNVKQREIEEIHSKRIYSNM